MNDSDHKTVLVAALEQAAVELRDAELAREAKARAYMDALKAFSRYVAPDPRKAE